MLRLKLVHRCDASWDEMRALPGGRHCASCDKDVLDLTRATEDEARVRLAAAGAGKACVRMNLDGRGRPLFAAAVAAAMAACGAPPSHPANLPAPEQAPSGPAASASASPIPATQVADDPDDDQDGIANSVDACPRAPGRVSDNPNQNGCPYVGIIVTRDNVQVFDRVAFARGQARPEPGSKAVFDDLVAMLRDHPELVQLEVEGHASSDEPAPQKLSEDRARAVVGRLVAAGVPATRLIVRGYGDTRPVASSSTAEGRAQNRSVSFRVVRAVDAP